VVASFSNSNRVGFAWTYSYHDFLLSLLRMHCGRQAGFMRGFLCFMCRIGPCCVSSKLLHANGILERFETTGGRHSELVTFFSQQWRVDRMEKKFTLRIQKAV
jgi:hypothetical protein